MLYHPGHQGDITFHEWAGDVVKRGELDGGGVVGWGLGWRRVAKPANDAMSAGRWDG